MPGNRKPKELITRDHADQIHALAGKGWGRNQIAKHLDVNSSAVKQVLENTRVNYSSQLSTRERQALLNRGFNGR